MNTLDCPVADWRQIFFLLGVTVVFGFVVRWILNKLRGIQKSPPWATTLCDSLYTPAPWLIWGTGSLLALEAVAEASGTFFSSEVVAVIRNTFLIIFLTWIVLRWKKSYEKVLRKQVRKKESRAQDEVLIMAISRVLSALILIVAALALMETFEIPLTALLAFGGVGGVAIGFAGKDVVANFFGGLMIHINRPFSPGERIRSPNKNFEGVIEDIGWYSTQLRSLDRKPTYIPNALFIDAIIENYTRMYNQRIKQIIGVRYRDIKIVEPIVEEIRTMLQQHSEIDQDNVLLVHFTAFGSYALEIEVICFTKTTDRRKMRDIQQEIFLKIAAIIDVHGGEIAFPTSTILFEENLHSFVNKA